MLEQFKYAHERMQTKLSFEVGHDQTLIISNDFLLVLTVLQLIVKFDSTLEAITLNTNENYG